MKCRIILIVLFLSSSGCMQIQMLPYFDQAMTLKSLAGEKDLQEKYVLNVDAKFDLLRASILKGDIKKYKGQYNIVQKFGPPITTKDVVVNGRPLTRSLYRYAIQSKGPHKVYLYFDHDAHLVQWESL